MDCELKGKWRGCKFEARYDERLPGDFRSDRISIEGIRAIKTYTYVKDVCVRCGKTIQRSD